MLAKQIYEFMREYAFYDLLNDGSFDSDYALLEIKKQLAINPVSIADYLESFDNRKAKKLAGLVRKTI